MVLPLSFFRPVAESAGRGAGTTGPRLIEVSVDRVWRNVTTYDIDRSLLFVGRRIQSPRLDY